MKRSHRPPSYTIRNPYGYCFRMIVPKDLRRFVGNPDCIPPDKPQAKTFKRWITHEVLPNIRRTGGYIHGAEQMSDTEVLVRAIEIKDAMIEQKDQQILEMQPKVTTHDTTMDIIPYATPGLRPGYRHASIVPDSFPSLHSGLSRLCNPLTAF